MARQASISALPWLPFHCVVDRLIDSLGLRKVVHLRLINHAFDREILDNLLSRCRINGLGLRERNGSGLRAIVAEFAFPPGPFMCHLLIYGMENGKLAETSLSRRIEAITGVICTSKAGLCSKVVQRSIYRVLFACEDGSYLRYAMFADKGKDISAVPVLTHAVGVAALMGDLALVQCLVRTHPYIKINWEEDSALLCRPLTAAAKAGNTDCCRLLIELGANPNGMVESLARQRQRLEYPFGPQWSAMDDALRAASRSGNLSVVQLFFEPGNNFGLSADYTDVLLTAAGSGSLELVKYLLDTLDIDLHGVKLGVRMLHEAAHAGHIQIASMLLEQGIDIDSEITRFMGGPLDSAAYSGHENLVRFLLERGATMFYNRGRCCSALGGAAAHGHLSTMRTLLEHGADPNEPRIRGDLPLKWAAKERQVEALRLLLDHGADIALKNCGIDALEAAIVAGFTDVVEVLIKAGVDVNGDGRTSGSFYGCPILAAEIAGNDILVNTLLQHGARVVDPLTTEHKAAFLSGVMPWAPRPQPLLRP